MAEIPRIWRNKDQYLRFEGEICPNGHVIFPKRDICPHCQREAKKPFQLSGKGTVVAFSTMYDGPPSHQKFLPYVIAHVRLLEGPTVTARLTDLPINQKEEIIDGETRIIDEFEVAIGDEVEMVTRIQKDEWPIPYGYLFRHPISSSPTEASMSSK